MKRHVIGALAALVCLALWGMLWWSDLTQAQLSPGTINAKQSGPWTVTIANPPGPLSLGGTAAVKGPFLPAAAGDPSLVVALSPGSPLPPGANVIGAVTGSGMFSVSGAVTITGPVSAAQTGPWPVAQGAPGARGSPWFQALTDGLTGPVGVTGPFQAASPLAPGLVVSLSPNSPALPGLLVTQGTTTGGQTGPLVQGAVTTAAPSYTAGQTDPLSLTAAGALRTSAASNSRTDTYTATANGVTVDASASPLTSFAIQVVGTGGAATSWDIRLEGSLNNVNFSQILQHTTTTGDGAVLWSGATLSPSLYVRSRVAGLVLGGATNVVVTILGGQ